MKRSPACDALVKRWEGYHKRLPDGSCTAYPDVAHGWKVATIGYGTTRYASAGFKKFGRSAVYQGDVLTPAEAESELREELVDCEDALRNRLEKPVTQGMFDAMCSFAFNVGLGGAQKQIGRINAGNYEDCAAAFDAYVMANGRPFQGLINRRNEEEALFRSQGLNPSVSIPEHQEPPSEPVSTQGRPYVACPVPLPWSATLQRDTFSVTRDFDIDVYWLQCALIGLGYLAKPKPGELVGDVFNEHVEYAVRRFQKDHMDRGADDGIVGPITRANIEAALTRARAKPPVDSSFARLTNDKNAFHDGAWGGLRRLKLAIGGELFSVASGARGAQTFRKPTDARSTPGNLEPIPQGRYAIGPIEFAGGKDNYEVSHGAGLGPVWVGLDADFSDDRGSFGIHLDSNSGVSPGSAGCVVVRSVGELRALVSALRKHDTKTLVVDWGL